MFLRKMVLHLLLQVIWTSFGLGTGPTPTTEVASYVVDANTGAIVVTLCSSCIKATTIDSKTITFTSISWSRCYNGYNLGGRLK